MSTRLLAAAAPGVVPPRDTLRAVAPDRYTLKVTIDQECEQGLRLLKGLLSHHDPRMSWGDLVARVVREAVARHDPRGGGHGQRRRRSAGSAGASPSRAPKKTRAAGAAAGMAQRVDESSQRAPNRTRAAGAPAAPAQRGGDTPAPQGDTPATERQNPIAMLANAAPPRQSAPAALSDGARAGGAPSAASAATAAPQSAPAALLDGARAGGARSGAPAVAAAPQFAGGASADGAHAGAAEPVSPVASPAPEPALDVSLDGGPSGASAVAAAGASADGSHAGAGVPVSPGAAPAPEPALAVSPDGGSSGASTGAAAHTTRDSVHSTHQSPPRRHIPAAVRLSGATSGYATEDAAVIAIRSPGVAAPLPICCRSTTCCRSPRAVARSRSTSSYRALLITACATTTDRLRRWSPRCSASVALLARRSTALADGSQVARRDTLRSAARRACIFAVASSDLAVVYRQRIPAASGVRTRCAVRGRRGESPERPGVPDAMLTGNNRTPMVDRQRPCQAASPSAATVSGRMPIESNRKERKGFLHIIYVDCRRP